MILAERVTEGIFQKLCFEQHEIDSMTVKYESLINLMNYDGTYIEKLDRYLKKKNFYNEERSAVLSEIKTVKMFEKNDNRYFHMIDSKYFKDNALEGLFLWCIDKNRSDAESISQLRERFKLTPTDIRAIDSMEISPYYNHYYVDSIKAYLNDTYGLEKYKKRIVLSQKKSVSMKKQIEVRVEKQEDLKKQRKMYILDLFASAGLYMSDSLYNVRAYIDGETTLSEEDILKEAKNYFTHNREMEVRKENLKEELENNGILHLKKDYLCRNFINYGNNTVSNIVNMLLERIYLEKNTSYVVIFRSRNPHLVYYCRILDRTVNIREYTNYSGSSSSNDDYYKSYAVEDKLRKNGWDIACLGEMPPYIQRRVEDVINRREQNEALEVAVKAEIRAKEQELEAERMANRKRR